VINSSDVVRLGKSSEEERRVMRECTQDAFWSRAMPSATVAGASIYWAVRAGKLKSVGSSRFRTWSVVAGFSSLAYFVAKISYVLGENCKNKFLIQAPDSDISKHIRKKRDITKSDVMSDSEETMSDPFKLLEIVDSKEFDERKMTDKEQQILIDCNSTAFYQFSLPTMVVAGATSYFGLARSPRFQNRSRMAQSAPVALACGLGYFMGQLMYLYSTDCADRFVKYAPEGSIAKKLQQHLHPPQEYELCEGCQTVAVLENERDEYVIPTSDQHSLNKLVNDTQPSPPSKTL